MRVFTIISTLIMALMLAAVSMAQTDSSSDDDAALRELLDAQAVTPITQAGTGLFFALGALETQSCSFNLNI